MDDYLFTEEYYLYKKYVEKMIVKKDIKGLIRLSSNIFVNDRDEFLQLGLINIPCSTRLLAAYILKKKGKFNKREDSLLAPSLISMLAMQKKEE